MCKVYKACTNRDIFFWDSNWDDLQIQTDFRKVLHPSPQNYKDMAFVAQYANTSKKNREKWLRKVL